MNSEARKRLHGDTCAHTRCTAHAELRRLQAIETELRQLRNQWHDKATFGTFDDTRMFRWLVSRLDMVLAAGGTGDTGGAA